MDTFIIWLKDLFHASYDAIAGVIITIATFILGFLLNELFKAIGKYRQRLTYRTIILRNINKMIGEVSVRSENISFLIKFIKVDKETNLIFKYDDIPSLEVLKNIGYENTYRAFFTGLENYGKLFSRAKRLDALNSLWNTIEYLNGVQKSIKKEYEDFIQEFTSVDLQRHSYVRNVQDLLDDILTSYPFEITSTDIDNFLIEYNLLHTKTFSVQIVSASKLNVFHQELRNLYVKNLSTATRYKEQLKTKEIIPLLNKSRDTFNLLINISSKTKDSFTNTWQGFLQSHKELSELEKILKK